MTIKLPAELVTLVYESLPFSKYIILSGLAEKYKYNGRDNPWEWAAKTGQLQLINWLHQYDAPGYSNWVMHWAAMKGYLDIVVFLHEQGRQGCSTNSVCYIEYRWIGHQGTVILK
jgi:ankyrin repeat protein